MAESDQPAGVAVDRGVMAPVELATALRCAAYSAYTLALSAQGYQCGAFDWFKNVQPGDMVIETSTAYHRNRDMHGIGWLEKKTREEYPRGEAWEEGDPIAFEDCWYIRCFDGVVYRWTNADFVRVPTSIRPWRP